MTLDEAEYRALNERMEGVIARNTLAMEGVTHALEQVGRALDDMRDQVRANTRAVLAVLDRLG